MYWKVLLLIAIVGSVVSADEESSSFELPADWANIRSNIDTSFSCVGRAYGYYADIYNDCQLYHVCNPRIENGETIYTHNPFICSLGTVFDQRSQTCVHQTSDFSCAESVQYYSETEGRYADVAPVNEVSNVVSNPIVNEVAVVNEVANSPPVNENVLNQPANVEVVPENPIYSPIEKPSVPLNNVVEPVVNEAPVLPVVVPVVTEATNTEVRSNVVHHSVPVSSSVPLNNVPVVNEVPVVPVVRSNVHVPSNEHSEVVDVHPVSNVVPHYSPVLNRFSSQNYVPLVQPRKGPTKSINVAKTVPVINVSKGQKVVQAPVQPVKAVKAVVSQQVVQAPVQPVKAVVAQQVVQAPVQPVKAVKAVVAQQVVQAPVQPVKAVKAVVSQQVIQAPVQPAKAVVSQQVVQAPVQPAKSFRAPRPVVTQQVEVPRKNFGLVRQESLRSHVPEHVYYNNQPTWQYHYLRLYPHLVHNNPYHRVSRQPVRYVY